MTKFLNGLCISFEAKEYESTLWKPASKINGNVLAFSFLFLFKGLKEWENWHGLNNANEMNLG